MFQTALVRRPRLLIGRTPPVSGSLNPCTPCLNARFPVAIDVHNMGESTGTRVLRLPMTPRDKKRSRCGIAPSSSSEVMIFQSAASQPISRTLSVKGAGKAFIARLNRARSDYGLASPSRLAASAASRRLRRIVSTLPAPAANIASPCAGIGTAATSIEALAVLL